MNDRDRPRQRERGYMRHPSDIPIEAIREEGLAPVTHTVNDVSHGGLSFHSATPLPLGTVIRIRIPVVRPAFEARSRVIWCRRQGAGFVIGVEFLEEDDAFRARMVEQACHIEHYKREVLAREGRRLSGQEAAVEWIRKYARDFPNPEDDDA